VGPELRHLRYFVAVAEELSYTRAAARLNVVQQALSTAVKQLERELGVQLLVRTTRKVELTDAGHVLLEHGRVALEAVERSLSLTRLAAEGRARELRVAYTFSLGFRAVPLLHEAATEELPDVRLSWWEVWCAHAVGGVATGRFDAGIGRYPERLRQLAYATIAYEPQAALVSAEHEFAGASELRIEDLADETILVFPREMAPGYHDATVDLFRAVGVEPRTMTTPDAGHGSVKLSILESGAAVTIVPIAMALAWAHASDGGLVTIRLSDQAPPLPLDLFWNPDSADDVLDRFVELAGRVASEALLPASAGAH
jgi:DNA-binding transcriptional LysR family regulator